MAEILPILRKHQTINYVVLCNQYLVNSNLYSSEPWLIFFQKHNYAPYGPFVLNFMQYTRKYLPRIILAPFTQIVTEQI